jgi:hypothetical protein
VNSKLPSDTIGRFLIAIGAISILAFIFLIIFFVGYFNDIPSLYIFGSINDVLGSLVAVLSAVLATTLIFSQSKRWIWLNLIGAILTWIGVFIVTLDSLMAGNIIPKNTAALLRIAHGFPPFLTTHNQGFGFGLIGVWLVILNFQAFQTKSWPKHFIGAGFIAAILMTIGLAGSNGALGFVFIYPIWCIWLGRYILRTQERAINNE